MYHWKLKYYLKNGTVIEGIYHGNEKDSGEVAKWLLNGDINSFNGCRGADDKSNLLVRNGEIAALDISVM